MLTFVQGDTVGRVKERMQERLGVNDKVLFLVEAQENQPAFYVPLLLLEVARDIVELVHQSYDFNFKGVGQVQSSLCAAREASLCGGGRQSDQHQGLHQEHNILIFDGRLIAGVPWNGAAIARASAGRQALDWPRTHKQGRNFFASSFVYPIFTGEQEVAVHLHGEVDQDL